MSDFNKCVFTGRLAADPEIKYLDGGSQVCNFTLACGDQWKGKDGEKQEHVEWLKIVIWGKQAESCAKYLEKGRQALVEGSLKTRKWEDKDGNNRYTSEIMARNVIFLGSKSDAKPDNKPSDRDYGNDAKPDPDEMPF